MNKQCIFLLRYLKYLTEFPSSKFCAEEISVKVITIAIKLHRISGTDIRQNVHADIESNILFVVSCCITKNTYAKLQEFLQKKILSLFQILHKFSMLRVCSRKILKQVIVLKQQSIFRSLFLHVHDMYYLQSRLPYRSIFCFINTIFDRNCILLSKQPFFPTQSTFKTK